MAILLTSDFNIVTDFRLISVAVQSNSCIQIVGHIYELPAFFGFQYHLLARYSRLDSPCIDSTFLSEIACAHAAIYSHLATVCHISSGQNK